jgi:DNA-binding CsgD family transcriptional regulator
LELARAELAASGERGALRTRPAELELTAQELQVARVVAAGASNAEAASQLFLSPKTVEKHLTSAYRKLGLRSRAQLAAMFAANAPAGIAP